MTAGRPQTQDQRDLRRARMEKPPRPDQKVRRRSPAKSARSQVQSQAVFRRSLKGSRKDCEERVDVQNETGRHVRRLQDAGTANERQHRRVHPTDCTRARTRVRALRHRRETR